jgi:DNA-binding transcriptional regulator GbsR (MarR family)
MIEMYSKKQKFIEKFGLFFERSTNFPRIAGRIFAFLLICDPPEQTQKKIAQALNISKGSASTMIRLLVQTQIVHEFSKPGNRPLFYKIRKGGWEKLFLTKLQNLAVVRNLLNEGRSAVDNKSTKLTDRIDELDKLYAFFEEELQSIISKWEKLNQERRD